MSEQLPQPEEQGLPNIFEWLDQARLEEVTGDSPKISLEILLEKLGNHMGRTGQMDSNPKYGNFED